MAYEDLKCISLEDVPLNCKCRVNFIDMDFESRIRLYDLGFVPESVIVPKYTSFLDSTKAYYVKGTLIALRKETGSKIKVNLLKEDKAWKNIPLL